MLAIGDTGAKGGSGAGAVETCAAGEDGADAERGVSRRFGATLGAGAHDDSVMTTSSRRSIVLAAPLVMTIRATSLGRSSQ